MLDVVSTITALLLPECRNSKESDPTAPKISCSLRSAQFVQARAGSTLERLGRRQAPDVEDLGYWNTSKLSNKIAK